MIQSTNVDQMLTKIPALPTKVMNSPQSPYLINVVKHCNIPVYASFKMTGKRVFSSF